MATTLYPQSTAATLSRGGGDPSIAGGGAATQWAAYPLLTTRGSASSVINTTTNGNDAEITGGTTREWLSPSIDGDYTISGSITFNIRCEESAMTTNAGVRAILERVGPDGFIVSTIVDSAQGLEVDTAEAAQNWSVTPTSTSVTKGDRIRLRILVNSYAGTLATGDTFAVYVAGPTANATGDTYITLTETIGFLTAAPSGSVIYLTDTSTSFALSEYVSQTFAAGVEGWTAANWTGGSGTTATVSWQSDDGKTANGCLKAVFNSANGDSLMCDLSGTLKAGVPYSMGFYAYTSTGDSVRTFNWAWGSKSDSTKRIYSSNQYIATGVWTQKYYWGGIMQWDVTDPAMWIAATQAQTNDIRIDDLKFGEVLAREGWTSRGGGVVTSKYAETRTGWTTPLPIGGGSGVDTPLVWVTKRLQATTLSGRITASLRVTDNNAASSGATIRLSAHVIASDGSNPRFFGASNGVTVISGTSEQTLPVELSGPDISIGEGERIMFTVSADDHASVGTATTAPMNSGRAVYLFYAGTSGGASGDSYITLPITPAEASLINVAGVSMARSGLV